MKFATRASIAALVTAATAAFTTSAEAGWDKARDAIADSMMGGVVSPSVPSVAVCVANDGVPIYVKSFGSIALGKAASPNTIYRIGSLSKQFTAAAILALIESGARVGKGGPAFSVDNNVSLFFDGVDAWSNPKPMTVRRLLTMTSNLPNYTNVTLSGLDPAQPVKASDLLAAILKFKPVPRQITGSYSYSNTNYFLLANIIEQVAAANSRPVPSGLPMLKPDYRDYIRKRIFARANLKVTNFIDDPKPLGEIAPPGPTAGPAFANPAWPKGAGAIQSNVVDLCTWDTALVQGKVLNAESAKLMGAAGSPLQGDPPTSYAMGWGVTKFPNALEYAHGGEIAGYTAVNAIEYYGGTHFVSVVILTNGDDVKGLMDKARALATGAMAP